MDRESFEALIFGVAAFATAARGKWVAGEELDPVAAIERRAADMAKLVTLTAAQERFLFRALPPGFRMHPPSIELLRFSAARASNAARIVECGADEDSAMVILKTMLTNLIAKILTQ